MNVDALARASMAVGRALAADTGGTSHTRYEEARRVERACRLRLLSAVAEYCASLPNDAHLDAHQGPPVGA